MKTPLKIVHFHPNGLFASKFVDPLIMAERSHGFDSNLVTSNNESNSGGKIIPYDITLRNLPILLISFARICLFLKVHKPSVVISHNAKSSSLPLLAAWVVGVRSRIYFNHGVPFIAYAGLLRYLLMGLEYFNCSVSTGIVTVSKDMRAVLKKLRPFANITVIGPGSACGIDLSFYDALLYSESSFRKLHSIKQSDFVVVYIGRPERRKGYDVALRLWQNYFKEENYKLVLCGSKESHVLKILPEIPKNIICVGFAKNIPEILSNSNCLILPSLHEGLSYAILEAMACGCLVVANNIHGVRELICNGENGYLISNNTIPEYAMILKSIKNQILEIDAVKRSAFETAQSFNRTRFMPVYLQFIEKIMAEIKKR